MLNSDVAEGLKYIAHSPPQEHGGFHPQTVQIAKDALAEIEKLRGMIARNALQRLRGDDANEMYVTADDIKDSLEVLYAWQASKSLND